MSERCRKLGELKCGARARRLKDEMQSPDAERKSLTLTFGVGEHGKVGERQDRGGWMANGGKMPAGSHGRGWRMWREVRPVH